MKIYGDDVCPSRLTCFFLNLHNNWFFLFIRRFPGGLKDVADAASDPWKAISAREKERYEQMAKAHKAQDKKHGERYTSQGKPLSELKKEKEEKEQKVEDQKRAVVKLIDDAVRNDSKLPIFVVVKQCL